MAYRFEPNESGAEAFERAAREQLTSANTALTRDIQANPVDAVHTARKSVKKVRSLLRLMRGSLDARERREANAMLRDAAGRLSGTRDADVMIETLDEIAERYAGQIPHHQFAVVRDRLGRGQPPSSAGLTSSTARSAAELASTRERITGWSLQRQGWKAVESGLRRSYRRGAAAFERAHEDPTVANLHEWRKRVKDLWYHLRLLAPVCGEAVRGHAKDAHALADALGDEHDLAVLRKTLAGTAGAVPADVDAVLGLVDHRRAELRADAWALGERVYAERPKAFRRRMRAYWGAECARRKQASTRRPVELAETTRALAAH